MLGDRVEQLDVQFGVVLGQRLVSVMVDQLHHRAEGQGVGEAVLPLPMEDLYQLVVASFPAGDERTESWSTQSQRHRPDTKQTVVLWTFTAQTTRL